MCWYAHWCAGRCDSRTQGVSGKGEPERNLAQPERPCVQEQEVAFVDGTALRLGVMVLETNPMAHWGRTMVALPLSTSSEALILRASPHHRVLELSVLLMRPPPFLIGYNMAWHDVQRGKAGRLEADRRNRSP